MRAVHIAGAVVAVGLVVLLAYVVLGRGGSEGSEPVGPMERAEALGTATSLYQESFEAAAQRGEVDAGLFNMYVTGLFPPADSHVTGEFVSVTEDEIVISVPIRVIDDAYYIHHNERRFTVTEDTLWIRGQEPIDKGELEEREIIALRVRQDLAIIVDSTRVFLE